MSAFRSFLLKVLNPDGARNGEERLQFLEHTRGMIVAPDIFRLYEARKHREAVTLDQLCETCVASRLAKVEWPLAAPAHSQSFQRRTLRQSISQMLAGLVVAVAILVFAGFAVRALQ